MTLSDLSQGCSSKSYTTRMLTTQRCNNIVISWLYQTCFNYPFFFASNRKEYKQLECTHRLHIVSVQSMSCNVNFISCYLLSVLSFNNLATSLIMSIRLLQIVTNSFLHSCGNNLGQAQDRRLWLRDSGQAVRTQLVDGLLPDLLQAVRFLRV